MSKLVQSVWTHGPAIWGNPQSIDASGVLIFKVRHWVKTESKIQNHKRGSNNIDIWKFYEPLTEDWPVEDKKVGQRREETKLVLSVWEEKVEGSAMGCFLGHLGQ